MLSFACSNGVPCSSAATGSMRRAAIAMPRCALLPAAACTLLAMPATIASADVVVEGDHGSATVGEILGKPATFRAEERVERKSFQYYMPSGAKQGPDTWYTLRLTATVTFARDSGPGSVLISGSTNGRAGAQIEFYARRDRRGRPRTNWESVDIIDGNRWGQVSGPSATVQYENFLQLSGVQPELNRLSFETETFGAAEVESVTIRPASGVYATPDGPAEPQVIGTFVDDSLEVGESGQLDLTVSSSNSRNLEDVEVSVRPRSPRLFIGGSPIRRVSRLTEEGTTANFSIGRSSPGKLRVLVTAVATNGAKASTLVSAEVSEAKSDDLPWSVLAGLGLLSGMGMLLVVRRKRRREAEQ